ncbi:MAG: hypothetical protein OCD00_11875 [Colwellia sp.]
MKKYIIALSFISLFSSAGELETAVGFGHQYGGVLGVQFAYKTESSKYYGSVGLNDSMGGFGLATGFQTIFSENSKHAFGITLGSRDVDSEKGFIFATYDYHLNGFSETGLVVGAGIGVTRKYEFEGWSQQRTSEINPALTLNIGYKF